MKISGIYQILNILDGKFYIGSAKNLDARKSKHFSDLRLNRHENKRLQNACNKYGINNFSFIVIEAYLQLDDLVSFEQLFLNEWVGNSECYNINRTAESRLGTRHSVEARNKMSNAKKGKASVRLGMKRSDFAKIKMSLRKIGKKSAFAGKKHSEETKTKISNANGGKNSGRAKLRELDVLEIRRNLKLGLSRKEIHKFYPQISVTSLRNIANNTAWKLVEEN